MLPLYLLNSDRQRPNLHIPMLLPAPPPPVISATRTIALFLIAFSGFPHFSPSHLLPPHICLRITWSHRRSACVRRRGPSDSSSTAEVSLVAGSPERCREAATERSNSATAAAAAAATAAAAAAATAAVTQQQQQMMMIQHQQQQAMMQRVREAEIEQERAQLQKDKESLAQQQMQMKQTQVLVFCACLVFVCQWCVTSCRCNFSK